MQFNRNKANKIGLLIILLFIVLSTNAAQSKSDNLVLNIKFDFYPTSISKKTEICFYFIVKNLTDKKWEASESISNSSRITTDKF